MIDINDDHKSDCFIITKTDTEGYHRQIAVTTDELIQLYVKSGKIIKQW